MSKNKNSSVGFPLTTEIELVAIKGKIVKKKILSYGEALKVPKRKGWRYVFLREGVLFNEKQLANFLNDHLQCIRIFINRFV